MDHGHSLAMRVRIPSIIEVPTASKSGRGSPGAPVIGAARTTSASARLRFPPSRLQRCPLHLPQGGVLLRLPQPAKAPLGSPPPLREPPCLHLARTGDSLLMPRPTAVAYAAELVVEWVAELPAPA